MGRSIQDELARLGLTHAFIDGDPADDDERIYRDQLLRCILGIQQLFDYFLACAFTDSRQLFEDAIEEGTPGSFAGFIASIPEQLLLAAEPMFLLPAWVAAVETHERGMCYAAVLELRSDSGTIDRVRTIADEMDLPSERLPALTEALWRGAWRHYDYIFDEYRGLNETVWRPTLKAPARHVQLRAVDLEGPIIDDDQYLGAINVASIDWPAVARDAKLSPAGVRYFKRFGCEGGVNFRDDPAGARDFLRKKNEIKQAIEKRYARNAHQEITRSSLTTYFERLESGHRLIQHKGTRL